MLVTAPKNRIVLMIVFLVLALSQKGQGQVYSRAPSLRGKLGFSMLDFKLGTQFNNEPLQSVLLFQPTILWDMPTFRARLGVHFIGEYGGPYGAIPISGMGVSGYFYPFGISSAYEFAPDGTLFQKNRSGLFTFASFTPTNFNVNKKRIDDGSGQPNLSVFSSMYEFMAGAGFDYVFRANMILAVEAGYRYAAVQQSTIAGSVFYQGPCIFLVFNTAYY